MNSKKISAVYIILAMVLISSVQFISPTETNAAAIEEPTVFTPHSSSIEITKEIIAANGSRLEFYNTYAEETFSVIIEVTNTAGEVIHDANLTSPEINVTDMREIIGQSAYEEDWFVFQGNGSQYFGDINPGQSKSVSYTIGFDKDYYDTIVAIEYFTFSASNVTYQWGNGTDDVSYSNEIEFRVFEVAPTVRVEKFFVIGGINTKDGRQAYILNEEIVNVTVKIVITNFIPYEMNITGIDANPETDFMIGDSADLEFNTSFLKPNEQFEYSYEISPNDNGTFTLNPCEISATFVHNDTVKEYTSNSPKIELYVPIYDGDEWEFKIPLISVEKYFVITEENIDGDLVERYYSKLTVYNNTDQPVKIMINVTNTGTVTAYNITIEEETFNDWVFETDFLEVWTFDSLAQGENITVFYTVTPIILGSFKFEPTKLTYSYQNQLTLLYEKNYVTYSGMIELTVEFDVPEIDLTTQWWIAIGISSGVVLLAAIPLIVTFVSYRNKKKTQKGI